MGIAHCVLAAFFLCLVTAKPATDRQKRQSSYYQFCSRSYDLFSDFSKNLIQECSPEARYPDNASWQWTFTLPNYGWPSQYVNIQYDIRTEGQYTCNYDRLMFGNSVTVCGQQQGSFSVDVSGRTSFDVRFTSDGSVQGDLLQVTITFSNSPYFSTSDLPSYTSSGQTGGQTGSTPTYSGWSSPSYDWSSPSYDSSTYSPTPTSDYFSATNYPGYPSTDSWGQSSSSYNPWDYTSNYWNQNTSPYNYWDYTTNYWNQNTSPYNPWDYSTNYWNQNTSPYYPWDYTSNDWNQNTSPYYPWDYSTNYWSPSTYPWNQYTTGYPGYPSSNPNPDFELVKGQLLVALDDLVRVAQGLLSLLRQGQGLAQPNVQYASAGGKK